MGEAKRRAAYRVARFKNSQPLKRARFDLYALGARRAITRYMAEELEFWSDTEERVLGLVFRDTTDNDFGWMLLARDKIGRFRCADLETSIPRFADASDGARERIERVVCDGKFEALGDQEDEPNYSTDVLTVSEGIDPKDLHPFFKVLSESPGRHPARSVFREIAPWLAPADPDFVSEFQRKHFDQRLWEMYLWATLRELNYDVSQPNAPDFVCDGIEARFTLEATTVAASTTGVLANRTEPKTPEEISEYLANYMPMKFGSSLTSKLNKRDKDGKYYWERGEAIGKPFLIGIADFHVPGGNEEEPGSMTYTQSALWPYLYGHRVEWEMIEGQLIVRAVKGGEHVFQGKRVETGFFDLPQAENVSAILFSNAGTLAKFDRMGIAAGFLPENHKYFRTGLRFNPDPNAVIPTPFWEEIGNSEYVEYWSDELQIFHNPNAKHPLPVGAFPGTTQHFFKDGNQISLTPEGTVMASHTLIMQLVGDEERKTVL
ncbi:MAG TPA: hypothetical protein VHC39_05630 [Rhizomicrobium sp.]|nr:hypothetical protein [Rhizomicrobium sp.]